MWQVHDLRESCVYQEAKEEGLKEGIEKGLSMAVARMAARKVSAAEIRRHLQLDVEQVRQAMPTAHELADGIP